MLVEIAPRRRRGVSLTPLIDVVFNLLLFFMLASSLTDWRSLGLATGTERIVADSLPAAEVELQADGQARYNGQPFSLETLVQELVAAVDEGRISSVIIRPAEGVPLGAVVTAFDELNHQGIKALALGEAARDGE